MWEKEITAWKHKNKVKQSSKNKAKRKHKIPWISDQESAKSTPFYVLPFSLKQWVLTVKAAHPHAFRLWLEGRCVSWCALESSVPRASSWARGASGLACSAHTQGWDTIAVSCDPPTAYFWWKLKCSSKSLALDSMAPLESCSVWHSLASTWEWVTITS